MTREKAQAIVDALVTLREAVTNDMALAMEHTCDKYTRLNFKRR